MHGVVLERDQPRDAVAGRGYERQLGEDSFPEVAVSPQQASNP